MLIDYQIYLDEEQEERKNNNKKVHYICLDLSFYEELEEGEEINHNKLNLSITLNLYNHKYPKFVEENKPLIDAYEILLKGIKKNKNAVIEEEYSIHDGHYCNILRYDDNKLLISSISPSFHFVSTIHIDDLKESVYKIFKEFIHIGKEEFN